MRLKNRSTCKCSCSGNQSSPALHGLTSEACCPGYAAANASQLSLLPLKASSMCDMHLKLLRACPDEAQLTYIVVHAMQQHRMQASAAASQA